MVDNGWYKALTRDNVELVTDSITRFTPKGVETEDGTLYDVDVIVTATSPRGGGDPIKEAQALGDAAIAAARATGKRLIVVGGAGSLNLPDGRAFAETLPPAYRAEALAMRGVLNSLKAGNINWTFFSPAAHRIGTTVLLSDQNGDSRISAEDYAQALVNEIEKPAHLRAQMTIAY